MIPLPEIDDYSILKAVYGDDELYLDEDGKHIIFRNVRGRIVPIHVDSSDYVDWLRDQGIPIDVQSQENMQQAEQILDYLDRVREVAGPEMAAKYEKEVVEKYKEYYEQASKLGYQQALERRAQAKGVTSQELTQQYKQMYQQNKGNEIKASKDRVGEWSEFIGEYTQRMMNNSVNKEPASNEWGIAHATDLALMIALDKAKRGEAPATVSLSEILRDEIKTRDASSRLFSSRYDPKTSQQESGVAAISLIDGLENLVHNLDTGSQFGKAIESAFDKMYVRMFNDFDKPNQNKMSPLAGNIIPTDDFEVPDELPEDFSSQEANRLVGLYKSQGGNKLGAAHKIMLHTLGRLWEQIPEAKRVAAYQELNDEKKGIHQLHKLNFIRAFQDTSKGLREYNPDRVVEEVLREALHVKGNQNYNEVVAAMKAISIQMAQLDGYYAAKNGGEGTPSQKDVVNLWNNSPVLAGRARSRGEGPNLMQFFGDDAARNAVIFPNSVLKVLHKGRMPKTSLQQQVSPAFNEQNTPEVPQPTQPPVTESQPDNDIMGWRQEGRRFIDDSTGTEVEVTPIKLPSGAPAFKLHIKAKNGQIKEVEKPILTKGKSKDEVLREVVGVVKGEDMKSGQPVSQSAPPKSAPQDAPRPPRAAPETTAPETATKLHQEIISSMTASGLNLKHIQGSVYSAENKEGEAFHRVAINKNGEVVVSIKVGGKWVNQVVSSLSDAQSLMTKVQNPLIKDSGDEDSSGVQTETAIQALGTVAPGDANMLKSSLTHAVQSGLTYRALNSTKTVRIQNKNDKSKGYISVSNTEGTLKAHLITPDGNIEEIPMERLAEKTALLL